MAVDISEEDDVRRLFSDVESLGRLEILVNNAGGWLSGPQFPETARWRRSLDLNLVMPMLATQLALPLMVGGGAVVNVSSSAGRIVVVRAGHDPYSIDPASGDPLTGR